MFVEQIWAAKNDQIRYIYRLQADWALLTWKFSGFLLYPLDAVVPHNCFCHHIWMRNYLSPNPAQRLLYLFGTVSFNVDFDQSL